MKILIASELGALEGGRETYLREVAPLLRSGGHDLAFAFGQPVASEKASVAGNDPGMICHLSTEFSRVEAWKPDLVYLHGLADPEMESRLASRYPTVYFPHGYYGTCVSGTKCHTRPVREVCHRSLGVGCLSAYFFRGCGGRNPLTMLRLYRTERRRLANLCRYRALVVASAHMAEEFRRHGVSEERVSVLPLFPTEISPDPAPPAPRSQTGRVLFVGRVTPLKGLRLLIDALPLVTAALGRELRLIVAGDGPAREEAEATARAAGVPADFLGWIGPERRTAEMRVADVLAVPSLWPEPFGLVGIEAGCVGLPAAGFAVGGIPDWLESGLSGESVAPNTWNADGLADALTRVLRNASHWQHLRQGAWKSSGRFSRQIHLARLTTILNSCI